jgi:hypothetical protein
MLSSDRYAKQRRDVILIHDRFSTGQLALGVFGNCGAATSTTDHHGSSVQQHGDGVLLDDALRFG